MRVSKKLRYRISEAWQPALVFLASSVLIAGLFWFRIGTIPGGRAASEISQPYAITAQDIAADPANAPYKTALLLLNATDRHTITTARAISALAATLAVICFFAVLKRWHTTRVALLGTFMFATSSWIIHAGRYASADVLLLFVVLIILCGLKVRDSGNRFAALAMLFLTAGVLIYIPGLIWFVIAAAVWQRKLIAKEIKSIRAWQVIAALLLGIIVTVPLVHAAVTMPDTAFHVLGLPASLPSVRDMAVNLARVPMFLFWRGPSDPAVWLGRLPLLDFFSITMFLLGTYAYYIRKKLDQTRLLAGAGIIGLVLITTGGAVTITVLLPFVYIVIAAGIALMLQQWFTVFPRNPLARGIGTGLMIIAVMMAGFYHINRYFIAWPNAPQTRAIFQTDK